MEGGWGGRGEEGACVRRFDMKLATTWSGKVQTTLYVRYEAKNGRTRGGCEEERRKRKESREGREGGREEGGRRLAGSDSSGRHGIVSFAIQIHPLHNKDFKSDDK